MKQKKLIPLIVLFIIIFTVTVISVLLFTKHIISNKTPLLKKIVADISPTPEKDIFIQPKIQHVFVIVEENHDWSTIYKNPEAPYINKTLLPQGSYASNYHNVPRKFGDLHPSEPSYIILESGKIAFPDHTFTTDDPPTATNSTASTDHLTTLLEKNGYTWKSYQEGITGRDCPINTTNNYVPKHNPSVYFHDVSGNPPISENAYCQKHERPLTELKSDLLSGEIPNYTYITPNLDHDMHNGTIAQADTWLSQIVPSIIKSSEFKKDGALFITWDEGNESKDEKGIKNDPIGMIIYSPFVKQGYTNTTEYSHASLVKTIQEIFNLTPLLGFANDIETKDLGNFFNINN